MIESVLTLPVLATEAIQADRFVTPTGAVPAAGANCLGVALHAALAGEYFAADVLAVSYVTAGAAIANGAAVQTDASGRAITRTSGAVLGRALSSAATAGDRVKVLLIPTGDMSEAAGPVERVANGAFANTDAWVINNSAWAIAGGVATGLIATANLGATSFRIYQTFAATLATGTAVSVSLDIVANPSFATLLLQLRMNGAVVETLSNDVPAVGPLSVAVTLAGPVNQIWIACMDDTGLVIDNVSVIA